MRLGAWRREERGQSYSFEGGGKEDSRDGNRRRSLQKGTKRAIRHGLRLEEDDYE